MNFRRSELFLIAYFLYAAALALLRPAGGDAKRLVLSANAAVIGSSFLFAWAHRGRGFLILDYVRDWFPLPLILLAYREMGWLALPHPGHAFEDYWIRADRLLLYGWRWKAAIESLGPLLPNLLELCYLLVYGMPILTVAVLYYHHSRQLLDDAYTIILFATLTTYALYPLFPSEPPRAVYPFSDLPEMSALRAFNLRILGAYGIHMSVFPSGHSAAAFASAFAVITLLRQHRVTGILFLLLAAAIGIATFYGRYHFAIDTLAGLAMALFSLVAFRLLKLRVPQDLPDSSGPVR